MNDGHERRFNLSVINVVTVILNRNEFEKSDNNKCIVSLKYQAFNIKFHRFMKNCLVFYW